jgi:hypothetical protein
MAKPSAKTCECGCGGEVRSRYLPGHDAKHKSALINRALSGEGAATRELRKRGWQAHLEKSRASRKRKAKESN